MATYQMPYAKLKGLIIAKTLSWQYVEDDATYRVFAIESDIQYEATIYKEPVVVGGVDRELERINQTDFETNYKATSNQRLAQQIDSDGAPMSRVKVAPSGWSYQLRMSEFQTSVVGSLINRDAELRDLSDVTLTLYDALGVRITAPELAIGCVKTVLDIEPQYDYYVVGGNIKMGETPNNTTFVNVVGVPDIPAQFGGSKIFVQNVNLRYVMMERGVEADGRAAKWLKYDPVLHTNKLRFIIHHEAGYRLPIAVFLELFKL